MRLAAARSLLIARLQLNHLIRVISMARDLSRWIETLLTQPANPVQGPCWHPPADTYRIRGGWLVKFDLAGVRPEDIRVSLLGRRLTVEGTRRDWQIDEGQQHYCMEISYSHFERSVELPRELAQAQVSTEYRDGMLLVRLLEEANS
jgi:HSP20 family protein